MNYPKTIFDNSYDYRVYLKTEREVMKQSIDISFDWKLFIKTMLGLE